MVDDENFEANFGGLAQRRMSTDRRKKQNKQMTGRKRKESLIAEKR